MSRTSRRITRFIVDSLLDEPYFGSDPLADELLDSLAIEELITFLEERYGVSFSDEEVVAENFASVRVLAVLVDGKRRARKRRVGDAVTA